MKKKNWFDMLREAMPAFFLFLALVLPALVFSLPAPAVMEADAPAQDVVEEPLKLIALTFDDGPRRSTTTRLLDGLAARGVPATFFVIGAQIEGNEDVLQRMDAEGHQIGIHTYDHVKLTALSCKDFQAQVDRTRTLLKTVLGHNDFLLRPPYGMVDSGVRKWAGCPIILWSIDPEDWKDQNAAQNVKSLLSKPRDGGIILMHDIFSPSVDSALQAIDELHKLGYVFVTIDELFAARGIDLKPGCVYWNAYP